MAGKKQEQAQTIRSVVADTTEGKGQKPNETLGALDAAIGKEKLNLRLTTQSEISEVRAATEKALAKGNKEGIPYLGQAIDSIASRRQQKRRSVNFQD